MDLYIERKSERDEKKGNGVGASVIDSRVTSIVKGETYPARTPQYNTDGAS